MRRRRATVATRGEWQCKTGGVRRLAVANGPNIFQMILVLGNFRCVNLTTLAIGLSTVRIDSRFIAYLTNATFSTRLECG